MKTQADAIVARLAEAGGRAAQELGFGRLLGQVLVYLYLCDGEQPLEAIEADLGLSKAAASTAARRLESLGLLVRVWRAGDRRSWYRTADNLATALQQGLLGTLATRVRAARADLAAAEEALRAAGGSDRRRLEFLRGRVRRAAKLCDYFASALGSPVLRILAALPKGGRR